MRLQLDAGEVAIEGEVEVEPSLLAIRDDVEPRLDLVVQCRDHRVVLQLGQVVRSKAVKVLRGELQPARERVGADDGGAEGHGLHVTAR
jgi:hypothetical protein